MVEDIQLPWINQSKSSAGRQLLPFRAVPKTVPDMTQPAVLVSFCSCTEGQGEMLQCEWDRIAHARASLACGMALKLALAHCTKEGSTSSKPLFVLVYVHNSGQFFNFAAKRQFIPFILALMTIKNPKAIQSYISVLLLAVQAEMPPLRQAWCDSPLGKRWWIQSADLMEMHRKYNRFWYLGWIQVFSYKYYLAKCLAESSLVKYPWFEWSYTNF